jgi:hypothetical protein
MCNDFANHIDYDDYLAAFSQTRIPVTWPDAIPNLQPRDDIWPTDRAPVTRRLEAGVVKIITRRDNDWTSKYPSITKALAVRRSRPWRSRSENRQTAAPEQGILDAWIWTTTPATVPSRREIIVSMAVYSSRSRRPACIADRSALRRLRSGKTLASSPRRLRHRKPDFGLVCVADRKRRRTLPSGVEAQIQYRALSD